MTSEAEAIALAIASPSLLHSSDRPAYWQY